MTTSLQRQRLLSNPAEPNELAMLECARAWEPGTIRELGSMVRNQDPTALFLAETEAGEDRLKRLCRELLFDHFWIVPQVNKTGCLALF